MFRFLALSFLTFAQPVWAACAGNDLRALLNTEEQAALAAELNGQPYTTGNHWRATRGDSTIHLIGTMHLADPRLEPHVQLLAPIVENADLLLLEMTDEDEKALQTRLSSDTSLLLLPDASLPELLSEEDWNKMSDALSARGLPPFMAARFQPWYVSILLAIPPCATAQDLSVGGMDARLEEIAMAADVPRRALEDAETIFASFATQPQDVQVQMMLSALVDPSAGEDMFATLLASYFDENHAEGWAVSALLAQRFSPIDPDQSADIMATMEQTLLVDRNRAWLPVLLDAAKEHDTVVAAFGAAHLSGETGIPALLAAEGFTLERLPF